MDFSLDLPTGHLAEAIVSTVRSSETTPLFNHSVRSFLFAEIVAAHEGCLKDDAYDRELLFAATVLHDLGIGNHAKGEARFEVEGADLAADLLRQYEVPEPDIDRVWEAIALHTSPGIAERRGLLSYLTREGVGLDFGRKAEIARAWEKQIHGVYPRLDMVRSLVDAIVERAAQSDAAAPRYAIGGELLLERQTNGVTRMEVAAASSPWGA
ncbi:HD domain-containing protein [Streptomyces sp. NBC_00038]|uniref:HD domain-containing protein n=1 Tax=Streptomyces sp. NBC_00038 TaxID=2903615 RepID=UPI00224CB108|nr:HD domain-containing protein [Streptomyces sp. NBC_00038]MCX5554586.1 HD domain-containing protein [Streptomyces sp. NBC_00038]